MSKQKKLENMHRIGQVNITLLPTGNALTKLNTANLDGENVTDRERKHTIAHELGHALGLAENDYSDENVMAQGQYANLVLTADDKASYDAAAARY